MKLAQLGLGLFALAVSWGAEWFVEAGKEEKQPAMVLHVVHIKPSEEKQLELTLREGAFRPGTRDLVYVERILKKFSDEKVQAVSLNKSGFIEVEPALEMQWNQAGLKIRAGKDAAAGVHHLRFRYDSFLHGSHSTGLQIKIEP